MRGRLFSIPIRLMCKMRAMERQINRNIEIPCPAAGRGLTDPMATCPPVR